MEVSVSPSSARSRNLFLLACSSSALWCGGVALQSAAQLGSFELNLNKDVSTGRRPAGEAANGSASFLGEGVTPPGEVSVETGGQSAYAAIRGNLVLGEVDVWKVGMMQTTRMMRTTRNDVEPGTRLDFAE